MDCCGPSVSRQTSLPITPHPHDPLPHGHQIENIEKPLPPSCFISCSDRYMFKPMYTVNFSYSLGSCSFVWFTQGCPRIDSSSQPSQASPLFNVLYPTPLFVSHLQPTTFPSKHTLHSRSPAGHDDPSSQSVVDPVITTGFISCYRLGTTISLHGSPE